MSLDYVQMMVADTFSSLPPSAKQGQIGYCQDSGLSYIFDGSFWSASAKVSVKKTTVVVNLKTAGVTPVYTLENSINNFYPTQIIARSAGAGISGVVVSPTFSVGTNSTAYNNIASSTLMSSIVTALTGGNSLTQNSYAPSLPGGSVINVNVTVGATATNYTVIFDIIGFYDL